MLLIIYLAFGVWAAGYLIGWRNSIKKRIADISNWLLLVIISVILGPIMLAAVYFNGMMKHPWTFHLDHHGE